MTNLRVITPEEGREYAEKLGLRYFELSARNGEGVNELFDYVAEKVIESMDAVPDFIQRTRKSFILATTKKKEPAKKDKCCV